MKNQKIRLHVLQKQRETAHGSTGRDDGIDLVEDMYNLSSHQLRQACLNAKYVSYWNR